MSARGSDPRVKALVDERMPSRSALKAALRACSRGAKHLYQPSYGHRNFENTGIIFEICPAKDGEGHPQPCAYNRLPLRLQMSKEQRIDLLHSLSELEMPPYNSEKNATDCLLWSLRLRHGTVPWPPAMPDAPITPTTRPASASSHSHARSGAQASSSAKPGRPHNPMTTVMVYVYAENGLPPLELSAQGTQRGSRVEFTFRQPLLDEVLSIDKTARKKKVFLLWLTDAREWSEYPKAHSPQFLPPGQALLYKAEDVYDMPKLREFQQLVTPVLPAAETGTAAVSGSPTRPRLPSLLQHASHPTDLAPSSPPRASSSSRGIRLPTSSPGRSQTPRSARSGPLSFSPISSPDLPDALEIVRRHWASKAIPSRAEDVASAGASTSATILGKRRAWSRSASPNPKRSRKTPIQGKAPPRRHAVAVKEEVIELSDDDVPPAAQLPRDFSDVIELSDQESVRTEVHAGRVYIVISDDE